MSTTQQSKGKATEETDSHGKQAKLSRVGHNQTTSLQSSSFLNSASSNKSGEEIRVYLSTMSPAERR